MPFFENTWKRFLRSSQIGRKNFVYFPTRQKEFLRIRELRRKITGVFRENEGRIQAHSENTAIEG